MMLRTTAFALLLLFQAAQTTPPAADAAKKALDQIQGQWQAVSLNGQTGALAVSGARDGDGENSDAFLWSLATGTLHIGKDS